MAYRLALEAEQLQTDDATGQAAIARAPTERMVPTLLGSGVWTHAAVARVQPRTALWTLRRAATATSCCRLDCLYWARVRFTSDSA